ncbi:hypothetical protein T484DRAFT_1798691, partial [Baffinella frigidus]
MSQVDEGNARIAGAGVQLRAILVDEGNARIAGAGVQLRAILVRRKPSTGRKWLPNGGKFKGALSGEGGGGEEDAQLHFQISAVEVDSGAAKTGVIAVGDWLLGVDGTPLDGLSVQDIDWLLGVDGTPLDGLSVQDVEAMLLGTAGSMVHLSIVSGTKLAEVHLSIVSETQMAE